MKNIPTDGNEFRQLSSHLELGVAAAVIFGLMGIFSTLAALFNIDGSFGRPILAAVVFGLFFLCASLTGCWLALSYHRHRLVLSPDAVTVVDCFCTRSLRLVTLHRAKWSTFWKGGSLVLDGSEGRIKVHFANYTYQDRGKLINFFRRAVPEGLQDGWDPFQVSCQPPQVDFAELSSQIRGHLRFSLIAWMVAIPFMYAILIWSKKIGGLPNGNWFMVALLPPALAAVMVGFTWLACRMSLANAKSSD